MVQGERRHVAGERPALPGYVVIQRWQRGSHDAVQKFRRQGAECGAAVGEEGIELVTYWTVRVGRAYLAGG